MAMTTEPEKKVFDDTTSDDVVLEQLGYTQGNMCFSIMGRSLMNCRAKANF
jgi:hypothetical protein